MLERGAIVRTALDLLDQVGLEQLTMRRLADALGVQAPSLYGHYPNKQALLDDMADALLDPVGTDFDAAATPSDLAAGLARQIRQALLRRRDGARLFAGTFIAHGNVLRIVRRAAESRVGSEALPVLMPAFYYTLGFVIEEQGLAELSAAQRQALRAAAEQTPAVAGLVGDMVSDAQDARFESGLARLLAG